MTDKLDAAAILAHVRSNMMTRSTAQDRLEDRLIAEAIERLIFADDVEEMARLFPLHKDDWPWPRIDGGGPAVIDPGGAWAGKDWSK